MARERRMRLAGVPWHVRQRGNNGMACFVESNDRELYLGLLAELAPPTGCSIHSYVLMTNHIHLLVTPDAADSVPRLMKAVGERYVRQFNSRRKRYGTLWEGRYRSCPVDDVAYLLKCHAYIELNPVRARICSHPADYAWSSYRANAHGEPSLIIKPHRIVQRLGDSDSDRRAAYRAQFAEDLTEDELRAIRDAISTGYALGRQEFIERVEAELHQKAARRPRGRPRKDTSVAVPTRSQMDLEIVV